MEGSEYNCIGAQFGGLLNDFLAPRVGAQQRAIHGQVRDLDIRTSWRLFKNLDRAGVRSKGLAR